MNFGWSRMTLAVLLVGLVGCSSTPSIRVNELRGARYSQPIPKPVFVLNDTDGNRFDFAAETEGYVALVFFGYTFCPDVCPVHLANIGAVLRTLPPDVADKIKVVFVTTDPGRDTPERIREWLDYFDRDFVGLTGPLDSVNVVQKLMYLPPAMRLDGEGDDYTVGHSSRVVAFTTDNVAHVSYPFGIRQEDWAHDLPLLVKGKW